MTVQAQIPAKIDAPDKILFGLTVRQLIILCVPALVMVALFRALAGVVTPVVLLIAAVPPAALAIAIALGRRDGITLDAWIVHAWRSRRGPRRFSPQASEGNLAPLTLPAEKIDDSGVVAMTGGDHVMLVACSTVGYFLRDDVEQQATVDGFARWCNSLSGPAQITVTSRPVDLASRADAIEARLEALPHAALETAAAGYADFLRQLTADRDPLARQVIVTHRGADPATVRRAADSTARALTGTGATTRVLDGPTVTDVLVAACNPWQTASYGRVTPDATITAGDDYV
jgi:hypothetical protein